MSASVLQIIVQGEDRASGVLGRIGGALGAFAGDARQVGAGLTAAFTAPIAAIGALGISYNAMKEQALVAFTTMLGSAEAAKEYLQDLATFAAKTPFEIQGLTSAAQRLMAMGFAARDVIPMMTNIGDAVAALGGGQFEIDRVVRALGQMQARGKTTAQEMLQLTEEGVPAWKYLAETLGTDVAGAMKAVEEGTVDSATTINAVLTGMGDQFGGMMEQQSQTWNGVMSTIKDTVKMTVGDILLPLFTQARDLLLRFANEVLPQIQQWFAAIPGPVRDAATAFGLVLAVAGPLLLALGPIGAAVGALVSPIGLVVVAIGALAAAWVTNFGGIRETTAAVASQVMTAIDSMVRWIKETFGVLIMSVQDHAAELQAQFRTAWESVKSIVTGVVEQVRSIVQSVMSAIQTFIAAHGEDIQRTLGNAWTQIARIVNLALDLIKGTVIPVLKAVADFIKSHGTEIQTVLSGAWTIIKTVIQTVLGAIEGILRAALAVLKGDWKGAWEAIKGVAETLWNGIKTIIETALKTILGVVGTSLEEIKQWFVNKWNEITGFLRGIDLGEIGRGMIQGLIGGIQSMAGALVDAAKGVIDNAIAAAKNLLGIRSPSRVFREIGENSMRGLAQGFERSQPMTLAALGDHINRIVEELQRLADTVIEPAAVASAKALTDPLKAILENVAAMVEALGKLGELRVPMQIEMVLKALGTAVKAVVDHYADMANRVVDAAAVWSANAFTKPVAEIMGNVKTIVDGVVALNELATLGVSKGVAKAIGALGAVVQALITELGRIAKQIPDLGAAAAGLAENAGPVLEVVGDAVGAFIALGEDGAAGLDAWGNAAFAEVLGRIDDLGTFVGELVRRLGAVGREIGKTANVAADFAEQAQPVTELVSSGMKALKDLATYSDLMLNEEGLEGLPAFVARMVQAVSEAAATLDDKAVALAADFAERAKPVFDMVVSTAKGLVELGKFQAKEYTIPAEAALNEVADYIAKMVSKVGEMRGQFTTQVLADAAWLSEMGLSVFKMIYETAKGLGEMAALEENDLQEWAYGAGLAWVTALADGIRAGIGLLEGVLSEVGGMLAGAVAPQMAPAVAGGIAGGSPMSGGPVASTTVNIYNPVVRDDTDIAALADQVSKVLSRRTATATRTSGKYPVIN